MNYKGIRNNFNIQHQYKFKKINNENNRNVRK